jgi:hypothetical protein
MKYEDDKMKSKLDYLLEKTEGYISIIEAAVDNLMVSDSKKDKAIEDNLYFALEQQRSIVSLLKEKEKGCESRVKLQFEAFLRGTWLDRCSTKEEEENVTNINQYPNSEYIINALIKNNGFYEMELGPFNRERLCFKEDYWSILCNYKHINDSVEKKYSDDDLIKILDLSNWIALLSAYRLMYIFGSHNDGLVSRAYWGLHS